MTTREQNERLTRVGPGTPMGNLLRRYWTPVGTALELEREPVQRVRLFGEDLTLFKLRDGSYGLIGARCSHRCVSLEFGIPEDDGLRCPYHGWKFDKTGACTEQPFEERVSNAAQSKKNAAIPGYKLQELGGLLFAYMGPEPAPLLPRWDLLVRDDIDKVIEIHTLPCNWLQCMDNAVDPVHFEFLHAVFGNYQMEKMGKPPAMKPAKHVKIAFDLFKYGINKRRLLEGESEDSDEWAIGHPLIFPNLLAVGSQRAASLQFRIAVDDTNTMQFGYRTSPRKEGATPKPIAVKRTNLFNSDGKIVFDNVPAQDMVAWVAQGAISDRSEEHLGHSDKGLIMYHRLLQEQMDRVERGEEPMALIRDKEENEPMIVLNRERNRYTAFDPQYPNYFEKVRETADIKEH